MAPASQPCGETRVQRRKFLIGTGLAAAAPCSPAPGPSPRKPRSPVPAPASSTRSTRNGRKPRRRRPASRSTISRSARARGINQIKNRTVDFGASDAPLTAAQLAEANLLQFPAVMGSVVAIVNIPGVEDGKLKLTGELLADIYLGKITKWNDPRIAEVECRRDPAEPGDRPGLPGGWVRHHLRLQCPISRRCQPGVQAEGRHRHLGPACPAGAGARGNEGVAGTVKNIRGAIGYVENAYAGQNKLVTTAAPQQGRPVRQADAGGLHRRGGHADWSAPGFAASMIDQQGDATPGRSSRRPSSCCRRTRTMPAQPQT